MEPNEIARQLLELPIGLHLIDDYQTTCFISEVRDALIDMGVKLDTTSDTIWLSSQDLHYVASVQMGLFLDEPRPLRVLSYFTKLNGVPVNSSVKISNDRIDITPYVYNLAVINKSAEYVIAHRDEEIQKLQNQIEMCRKDAQDKLDLLERNHFALARKPAAKR